MTTARDTRDELERAANAAHFPVGVFWTDREGRCIAVNPRWCELSGLSEAESLGHGWIRAIHPDDRARVAAERDRHLSIGKNLGIEFRLLLPDGQVNWVLSQAVASFAPDGSLEGAVGTITDITGRKRAEEALRDSENRYRGLVDLFPDMVAIHREGVLLYVNRAGLEMMRATDESDLVGHSMFEFILPEYRAVVLERQRALAEGREPGTAEIRARRCDGEVIWIESMGSRTVFEGRPAAQLVVRDITERRRTTGAYRAVVENIRESMWVMERGDDAEWRAVFVNKAYVSTSGLESDAVVLNKTLPELAAAGLLSPEDAARSADRYNRAALSDSPMEFENRLNWNGQDFWFVTTMTPVLDGRGPCNTLICWSRDLTGRRRQEQRLAESEANYRAVVEGTSDAVWAMDRGDDGVYRVRLANSRTAELLGRSIEDLLGKTLHEILPRAAADRAAGKYGEAEAAGGPIEYETVMEREGFRTEVVTHLTPLFDATGRCYRVIGSARDVSDRRRAESALLQAQKLESLGVLAGGIAHDFNNLLTTILGNLYLLEGEVPPESPLRAYTHDSRVAAERGADLVKRLLEFSRPGIRAREEVSLGAVFEETARLVKRTLGPAIELEFLPGPDEDRFVGEFASIQQVLLNLILNSRDAMPEGGRITVSRCLRRIGNEPLWVQRGLSPGRYHEIIVADEGTGMARELLQRIFDPFFTTKGVGKGTGLGLSTALSIVRAHGGWLEAESEPGTGSTFRIFLPVA